MLFSADLATPCRGLDPPVKCFSCLSQHALNKWLWISLRDADMCNFIPWVLTIITMLGWWCHFCYSAMSLFIDIIKRQGENIVPGREGGNKKTEMAVEGEGAVSLDGQRRRGSERREESKMLHSLGGVWCWKRQPNGGSLWGELTVYLLQPSQQLSVQPLKAGAL